MKIRGNILLARIEYVRRLSGDAGLEAVLSLLPGEDRKVLGGKLWEGGMYPVELNARLDEAIARQLSPGDPLRAFIDMGRSSAEVNLNGAHKIFIVPGDPQRFLAKAPQIYGFYYAVGHRTYEKLGPRSAALRTFEAENVTANDCLTVIGWHQRGLEICGAQDVRITHPKCHALGHQHCEYRFEWT